jgi:hypothetical protein
MKIFRISRGSGGSQTVSLATRFPLCATSHGTNIALKAFMIAPAVFILSGWSASAQSTTYKYTGNPFNTINTGGGLSGYYTTTDYISGTITLSSPLSAYAGGWVDVSSSVTAISFTDGVSNDSLSVCAGGLPPTSCYVQFYTGGGRIFGWTFQIEPNSNSVIGSYNFGGTRPTDYAAVGTTCCSEQAETIGNPGVWTQPCPVNGPCILAPSDGASPKSQFVALSGTGTAGDTLAV